MSDHLDFIRIQGLEVSDSEVFQGVSGGDVSLSPGDGDAPMLDWGEMPEEAVTLLSQYTDDVNAWLTKIQTYDPDDDTRAITDLAIPAIPLITSIVATGGASLPAVATAMAVQAVISTAGPALQNIANRFDENSLEYIMRTALLNAKESILKQAWLSQDNVSLMKQAWLSQDNVSLMEQAWLYQDAGTFVSILQTAWLYSDTGDPVVKSILKKALLYVKNTEGQDILESVLHDRLSDLAFVDAVIDFGAFRVHIKGKMIEYN